MENFDDDNALNEKHNYEVYSDKASNLLTFSMFFLAISLISYIMAFILEYSFDFGFIFELFALICVFIAKDALINKKIPLSKKCIIAAMCSIGWILIYDFIDALANFNEILQEVGQYYATLDYKFYYLSPFLVDIFLIVLIVLLYKSFSSLSYADGTKKQDNYSNSFYDHL